jgi:hypothetical protein
VALPLTLKSILRQKKNYGNSNISPCKNVIFKNSSKRDRNPSRYYNFMTISQVSTLARTLSFKNPHIKIDLPAKGQNSLSCCRVERPMSRHLVACRPLFFY